MVKIIGVRFRNVGKIYYFNKRYVLQKEKWVKYNGKKMYLGSDGTFVKDTWIDDKYLGPDGVYIKGYRDDRRTNKSKTGWVGYGQQWRYYRKNKLVTGWLTIGEKRYFFGSDGYMRAGWLKDQGHTYYMDTRSATYGQMMTGWCKIKDKYYYFFRTPAEHNGTVYPQGSMARKISIRFSLADGTQKIYIFGKNGACTNY